MIEEGLSRRGVLFGSSELRLDVVSVPSGATFSLRDRDGTVVVERRLESDDCQALADAIVVVLETTFSEWNYVPPNPNISASSDANQSATTAGNMPNAQRTVVGLRHSREPSELTPSAMKRTEAGLEASPLSFGTLNVFWTLGAGASFSLPGGNAQPTLDLGGGLGLPRIAMSVRARLSTSVPTVEGREKDRVSRWSNAALLSLDTEASDDFRVLPWIGGGLSLERLRALELDVAPTKTALSPIIASGIGTSWSMSSALRGWIDLSATLFLVRHIYAVSEEGEIGRGPRGAVQLRTGITYGASH